MPCDVCGSEVVKADGLCGICQIKAARRFPGIKGVEHPNDIDPETYRPGKEMRLSMKMLENHKDPRQRIDTTTARRWEKTIVAHADRVEARLGATAEERQRYLQVEDAAYRSQMREISRSQTEARNEVAKLSAQLGDSWKDVLGAT